MNSGPKDGEWFHIKPSAENHYVGGWFRIRPKEHGGDQTRMDVKKDCMMGDLCGLWYRGGGSSCSDCINNRKVFDNIIAMEVQKKLTELEKCEAVVGSGDVPGTLLHCRLGGDCSKWRESQGAACSNCAHNKLVFMKTKEELRKPVETLEKNVNHPTRYTKGKVECIDALEAAVVGKSPDEAICVANVIKYLWRYEEKEPLRSLKSAEWYLKRLIAKVEAREGGSQCQ